MKLLRRHFLPLLALLFLLAFLPFLIKLVQVAQEYLTRALGQPANIIVDTQAILGPLPRPWLALAQGGEEKTPMLEAVIPEIRELKPSYIRLDHLYDFYEVSSQNQNGKLVFNFSRLDQTVENILAAGALPFFSLSYMPPILSRDGNLNSPPAKWEDWAKLVQATIEHYSGKNGKNLNEVYYEVWNEPDLFGNWQLGRDPDYLLLYRYAALGANQAKNVNRFYLGGPATTGLSQKWLKTLFEQGLRLDFISWHRYSEKPENFEKDLQVLEEFLKNNPQFFFIKRIISEWGSTPENSPHHDNLFDAAHTLATLRKLLGRVDLAFAFEIKDGPSPDGKKYWGRWGLLTHEKTGVEKKPRYWALTFLNQIQGERLSLTGEGTWVTGLATRQQDKIYLLLVNFDTFGQHQEAVPVTFTNLESPSYLYRESFLLGKATTSEEITTNSVLTKTIFLPPQSVVLMELEPR